jgi:hypothetical protein
MLRAWLKRFRDAWRNGDPQEEEFWHGYDQLGGADYDPNTGERYEPDWDPDTEEWVYRDRRVKGYYRAPDDQ